MLLLLLTVVLCSLSMVNGDRPTVTTQSGVVVGTYQQSYNGREYAAFEGIPFAKPPIDELRFKDPIKAEPWNGVLDATTTYSCVQQGMGKYVVIAGEEDCLYLNVYVPKRIISLNDSLNVLVHIHGGAFMLGSPSFGAGPGFLMDKDLVFVSMNYRLGVLGFLSTEDEVVPGNMGMKDQVLALKWVQENIKQFGGNPDSVTLTGVSAGAAATHLHYFSKLSKGLFHRGFSQSGTAFGPWTIQDGASRRAKQLAAAIGCDFDSSEAFIDCMRQKSAKKLTEFATVHLHSPIPTFPLALFAPVVEKESPQAFLVDQPYNLLKSKNFNDLPWISSVTSEEGILGILLVNNKLDDVEQLWTPYAKHLLDYNDTICSVDEIEIASKIKSQYFGNKSISQETVNSLINVFSDRYFFNSLEESTRLQASQSKSNVFSYIYKYRASYGDLISKFFGLDLDYGVNHAADANLVYKNAMIPVTYSEQDLKMKDMLINMIDLFANNQSPKLGTVDMESVDTSEMFCYMSIVNPDIVNIIRVEELTPKSFWNSLPILENEKSAITC